jgi:hypothetical protein
MTRSIAVAIAIVVAVVAGQAADGTSSPEGPPWPPGTAVG